MSVGLAEAAADSTASGETSLLRATDAAGPKVALGSVIVVSANMLLRRRLASSLTGLRWRVQEASGGAQAMMLLEAQGAEAMVADSWLPDLEVGEFAAQARRLYPQLDVLLLDGELERNTSRYVRTASLRRNELLHAIREALA
jgi:CheY-like chemotaxis protein